MKCTRYGTLFAAALLVVGCSDTKTTTADSGVTPKADSGTTTADSGGTPTKETTRVTSSTGGKVATKDGKTTLDIPAGALPADTDITVTPKAQGTDTATAIYDFGPDGLKFTKPVKLAIKYDGAAPPTGKKLVLAWKDAGKWTPVAGSSFAGGMVSGDIEHFTEYTAIITDEGVVVTSSCSDVAKNFKPCGGSPVGAWKFTDVCFEQQVLPNPFPTCVGAKWSAVVNWNGTFTVTGDGKAVADLKESAVNYSLEVPTSCMAEKTCASLGTSMLKGATCVDVTGGCKCTGSSVTGQPKVENSTWTVDGTTLVMTTTGDQPKTTRTPFCVSGNQMVGETTETKDGKTTKYYMVLAKVPAP
ncbi:MAG: hypothetical protein IT371_05535 [Deltaproteobacteria bacterium]|nr:hypothetical protein [Deltaproteobacteria bacterium]